MLLTQSSLCPFPARERMAELMFDTFGVRGLWMENSAVLATYASGRVTALSVECGDSGLQVVPVVYGHVVARGCVRQTTGGSDVTAHLGRLLAMERGVALATTADREALRAMKTALATVVETVPDPAAPPAPLLTQAYTLPDGRTVQVGSERERCTEALFNPACVGSTELGVAAAVAHALQRCNAAHQADLADNIILSGGSTLHPGFPQRLRAELAACRLAVPRVRVVATPERLLSPWIGGSILGSFSFTQFMLVTRRQYHESGPSIIRARLVSRADA